MPNLKMMTTEAYQATDKIVNLSDSVFDFLGTAIHKSPRKRSRICTHRSVNEKLHEMFVIYNKETYVRPNKHLSKDESVYVLKGKADFIFFDDAGKPTQLVRMGAPGSGLAYYCRVPAEVWHTIIMRSEIVLFEGTPGPFNPAETIYADWGPAESERAAVAAYVQELDRYIATAAGQPATLPMKQVHKLVYQATELVVPLSEGENKFLKDELTQKKLDRIRICAHPGPDDRLHEMLMVFSRADTYIRPSMHVDKEESLLILEGFGTYFFFDEAGNVVDRVSLGPVGSGRSFYCRIPANTYHCLNIESPLLVAKETTSGPFSRSDTVFPDWAPDGSDLKVAHRYLATLGQPLRLSA